MSYAEKKQEALQNIRALAKGKREEAPPLKNHSFADVGVRQHCDGIHTFTSALNGFSPKTLDFEAKMCSITKSKRYLYIVPSSPPSPRP